MPLILLPPLNNSYTAIYILIFCVHIDHMFVNRILGSDVPSPYTSSNAIPVQADFSVRFSITPQVWRPHQDRRVLVRANIRLLGYHGAGVENTISGPSNARVWI